MVVYIMNGARSARLPLQGSWQPNRLTEGFKTLPPLRGTSPTGEALLR